jgi:NADH:ubiquinone oxidoreductase subunit 2 (subunit N)
MFVMMAATTRKLLFFSVIACANLFFGVFGAIGQTQLRSLFAYSSITHIGWIVIIIYFSKLGFLYYFIVYRILILRLVLIFNLIRVYSFMDMKHRVGNSWFYMICMLLRVLRIGGVPPFSGFFIKVYGLSIIV